MYTLFSRYNMCTYSSRLPIQVLMQANNHRLYAEISPVYIFLFKEISGTISVYNVLGGYIARIRGNIGREQMFRVRGNISCVQIFYFTRYQPLLQESNGLYCLCTGQKEISDVRRYFQWTDRPVKICVLQPEFAGRYYIILDIYKVYIKLKMYCFIILYYF